MTDLTREEINKLVRVAEKNDGRCDTCHQIIRIYRYPANKTLGHILRKMAAHTLDQEGRQFDIAEVGLDHRLWSQLSKLRFHGLVAKVKDGKGKHIPRRWIITRKGWGWLRGDPIQKYVVVFDNSVLGHEGEGITIGRAEGGMDYTEQPVSTAEAAVIGNAHVPKKDMKLSAIFKGRNYGGFETGQTYELLLDRLQVGRPVKLLAPQEREYRDIAAFQKDWRAV